MKFKMTDKKGNIYVAEKSPVRKITRPSISTNRVNDSRDDVLSKEDIKSLKELAALSKDLKKFNTKNINDKDVTQDAESKILAKIKKEADNLFNRDEEDNIIEDDEFNKGIKAVLELLNDDEADEESDDFLGEEEEVVDSESLDDSEDSEDDEIIEDSICYSKGFSDSKKSYGSIESKKIVEDDNEDISASFANYYNKN